MPTKKEPDPKRRAMWSEKMETARAADSRKDDREAVLARIRERKKRTGTRLSKAAIIGHRDAGRSGK
jgi:hypothetical protein